MSLQITCRKAERLAICLGLVKKFSWRHIQPRLFLLPLIKENSRIAVSDDAINLKMPEWWWTDLKRLCLYRRNPERELKIETLRTGRAEKINAGPNKMRLWLSQSVQEPKLYTHQIKQKMNSSNAIRRWR